MMAGERTLPIYLALITCLVMRTQEEESQPGSIESDVKFLTPLASRINSPLMRDGNKATPLEWGKIRLEFLPIVFIFRSVGNEYWNRCMCFLIHATAFSTIHMT